MKNITFIKLVILITITLSACQEEWLELKRDKQQVVPTSLKDLQALLDNSGVMNIDATPGLGELSTNDYYLPADYWQSLPTSEQRNAYIWAEEVYEGASSLSWNRPYGLIFYANLAYEGVNKIDSNKDNKEQWENVKGSALFYRSWTFFQVAQVFCKPYDSVTAKSDLGIPLRLESDVNLTSVRATVQQTYEQIIKDAKEALLLLPQTPLIKTRPGKAAANALLAKTYFQMGNYSQALNYVNACLNIQGQLIDYNAIDVGADYPFEQFNDEVIFHATMASMNGIRTSMYINPNLYNLYESDDLRSQAFFWDNDGLLSFKGSYSGSAMFFSGIEIGEIYLMRAECYARMGNVAAAMESLNYFLETRWEEGTFVSFVANDEEKALKIILRERHKSLLFRGIRWMDLRRLNQDNRFSITLSRELAGKTYQLDPQDKRYVFPFPDEVIEISGMQQNSR